MEILTLQTKRFISPEPVLQNMGLEIFDPRNSNGWGIRDGSRG